MITAFSLGAFGALAAEILQRWKQFNDLPEDRFRLMLSTLKFWSLALFLVALGGVGGLLAVSDPAKIDWKVCFLSGVGVMALVRNVLSGAAAQTAPKNLKSEPLELRVAQTNAERIVEDFNIRAAGDAEKQKQRGATEQEPHPNEVKPEAEQQPETEQGIQEFESVLEPAVRIEKAKRNFTEHMQRLEAEQRQRKENFDYVILDQASFREALLTSLKVPLTGEVPATDRVPLTDLFN